MCTRGASIPTMEEKCPHPAGQQLPSPPSSTNSIKKPSGPYGAYNDPILPASNEIRKIVGDMISMAGGVAAVLLQVAQPAVGAGVAGT